MSPKTKSASLLPKLILGAGAALVGTAAGVAAAIFSDPKKRQAAQKATHDIKNQAVKSVKATVRQVKKSIKKKK